jgi:hypothetical protein
MGFQNLLHLMRLDAEFRCHQGRNAYWPVDPAIAFFTRKTKHQCGCPWSIHELTLHPLQPQTRQMRLGYLMGRSSLNEGDVPTRG